MPWGFQRTLAQKHGKVPGPNIGRNKRKEKTQAERLQTSVEGAALWAKGQPRREKHRWALKDRYF